MRLLRFALAALLSVILFVPSLAQVRPVIGVDVGWVAATRLQNGWIVIRVQRILTPAARQEPWVSWRPPLREGDVITEIGGEPAANLSPITMMAFLQLGLWRQTPVKLERDGNPVRLELRRKMDTLETEPIRPVKNLKLSDAAPEFALPDLRGTVVRSSELRGRWVLLNFWGTWCGGCYSEFAALSELADGGGEHVAVLGIDMKDEPAAIEKFFLKYHLRYPVVLGGTFDEPVARAFNVSGCPTNVVIAPDGTVRFAGLGPQSLEAAARIIVNALKRESTSEAR